jgi:hypothetical protein
MFAVIFEVQPRKEHWDDYLVSPSSRSLNSRQSTDSSTISGSGSGTARRFESGSGRREHPRASPIRSACSRALSITSCTKASTRSASY